ncbi:L-rhamnose isomerase, partial [Escherichia coli]|uniref:L-rhamnose isomerase n=1 Tax=Escherichia coli TaxID=562 RepID=UPI00164A04D3
LSAWYCTCCKTAVFVDAGNFHSCVVISDMISAAWLFVPCLLLEVSRPLRWYSYHVVLLDDESEAFASEIVRHDLFDRGHSGLVFVDSSIDRIAAWFIG